MRRGRQSSAPVTRVPLPRPVRISSRVYRALLMLYPRSFRRIYREEMARLFCDCCRESYQQHGSAGLAPVWSRALLDLAANVLREYAMKKTTEEPLSRACSACNNEIDPAWTTCRYCGSLLTDATTHVIQRSPEIGRGFYPQELGRAANRPLSGKNPYE